jgi:sugar lactone lactonase YvrE
MRITIAIVLFLLTIDLPAQTSQLNNPSKIVIDSKDNLLVLLQYGIAKISPDGKVNRFTKDNPNVIGGKFNNSTYLDRSWHNIVIDSKDNIYLTERDDKVIYKMVFLENGKISFDIYAGDIWKYGVVDGPRDQAQFNGIRDMTIDKSDNIYVTDSYVKIAGEVEKNFITDNFYQKDKSLKYIKQFSLLRKLSADGKVTTFKNAEGKYILPNGVVGITADNEGNIVYTTGGFARSIEKIIVTNSSFSHVAGKPYKREWCPVYTPGDTSKAELFSPETIIVNKSGEIIYADERDHRVTKIAAGKVTTLAGNNIIDPCAQNIGGRAQEGHKDGKALTALFNFPKGLAYDSKGNLFIADQSNHCIRKLSPDGMVSSFTTFIPR